MVFFALVAIFENEKSSYRENVAPEVHMDSEI
jgi:hypothetical protein